MSSQSDFSNELIAKLTCTLELYLQGMIHNIPPARVSTVRHAGVSSSLGQLDILPAELVVFILNLLDFQSLSRLSRVALKGKALVEGLPAYKDMMENAPSVLTALGKTGLLRYHSALLLRQTIRSKECVSCFDFGGFLLLPTCERACFECLGENQSLRMTTPAIAKQCFGLTDGQLKRIPIMYSIPGEYGVKFTVSRRRVYRLVNVKQAKQLGIDIHGSVENLSKLLPDSPVGTITSRKLLVLKRLQEAPLTPPGCDLSRQKEPSERVEDDFGGMASIRLPYLTEAGPDHGRVCRGCQVTNDHFQQGLLPAAVLSELVPPGASPYRSIGALLARLRSKEGFLEHISTCYGVHVLLGSRNSLKNS